MFGPVFSVILVALELSDIISQSPRSLWPGCYTIAAESGIVSNWLVYSWGKEKERDDQTGYNVITRNAPELGNEGLSAVPSLPVADVIHLLVRNAVFLYRPRSKPRSFFFAWSRLDPTAANILDSSYLPRVSSVRFARVRVPYFLMWTLTIMSFESKIIRRFD